MLALLTYGRLVTGGHKGRPYRHRRSLMRGVRLVVGMALACAPVCVRAQNDSTRNLIAGDGAIVIKIGHSNAIDIGVSDSTHDAALACGPVAVKQFIFDLQHVSRLVKGHGPPPTEATLSDLSGSGTLAVTRMVQKGEVHYRVYVSDNPASGGFSLFLSPIEMKSLISGLQHVDQVALTPAAAPPQDSAPPD